MSPILMSPPTTDLPRLAWLFDIDGTLLVTEGASREAFSVAVRECFGVTNDLRGVPFAGRTEPRILDDVLAAVGRGIEPGEEERFWIAVLANMSRLLDDSRGRLLPGVLDMLDALKAHPEWSIGLLTGNMTAMARIKLERFRLADRFEFGSFGEEAPDRNALACLAVGRVQERFGIPPERCIVVGDTEHDVECARAAGARVVAVGTGYRSAAQLAVSDPDLVVEDLTRSEEVIAWARSLK